jgi:hypothetical protein
VGLRQDSGLSRIRSSAKNVKAANRILLFVPATTNSAMGRVYHWPLRLGNVSFDTSLTGINELAYDAALEEGA